MRGPRYAPHTSLHETSVCPERVQYRDRGHSAAVIGITARGAVKPPVPCVATHWHHLAVHNRCCPHLDTILPVKERLLQPGLGNSNIGVPAMSVGPGASLRPCSGTVSKVELCPGLRPSSALRFSCLPSGRTARLRAQPPDDGRATHSPSSVLLFCNVCTFCSVCSDCIECLKCPKCLKCLKEGTICYDNLA